MDAIQGESHIDVKDDREGHILSRQKGNINLIDVGLTKEMKSQHVNVQQKWADRTTNSINRGAKGNVTIANGERLRDYVEVKDELFTLGD